MAPRGHWATSKTFGLLHLCLLVSRRQRPAVLLSSLRGTGQPHNEASSGPMSTLPTLGSMPAVWPQGSHLTSLCFCILTCKMSMISICTSYGAYENSVFFCSFFASEHMETALKEFPQGQQLVSRAGTQTSLSGLENLGAEPLYHGSVKACIIFPRGWQLRAWGVPTERS